MVVHTVRQPFMCRIGQFTADEQELCIGLDLNTLNKTKKFLCYLGNNKKTTYEIDSSEALRIGHQWVNPKGKTVIIVPLRIAKISKSSFDEKKYNKNEAIREKTNQIIFKGNTAIIL